VASIIDWYSEETDVLHIKIMDTMSIGSNGRFGGLASIFMVDQKSSGSASARFGAVWGFETVKFLREDGRLTPNLQCGRTGYTTLSGMGGPTSS